MGPFRWILLLLGLCLLAAIFAVGRGVRLPELKLPSFPRRKTDDAADVDPAATSVQEEPEPEPEPPQPKPSIEPDSRVVTVRVMPHVGEAFPAEQLILALRSAGFRHGQFDIFHMLDKEPGERIRYSVASLVEPGSFDLSNLKDSFYPGISIFMVLPAPEDGVSLFDEMVEKARGVARDLDGMLVDEQGGTLSIQRERYMREEIMEFLRRHRQAAAARVG